jgi:aldose 1-epimerase
MGIDGAGAPGYDHCYARKGTGAVKSGLGDELPLGVVALLEHPGSGRKMTVSTDAPGVQFYTGNWLGDGAAPIKQHWALCLETENYPNAINTPSFPSCVLKPGQKYAHTAVHKFEW